MIFVVMPQGRRTSLAERNPSSKRGLAPVSYPKKLSCAPEGTTTSSNPYTLTLYTDGGARGNPGPAAIAYAIYDSTGMVLEKGAKYIGERTNNEAEYEAVLWGLEKIRERSCGAVRVITDSELVARQTTGKYKTRDKRMQQYADRVAINRTLFDEFEIQHARRSDERVALVDALVNEELERKGHRKK